MSIVCHYFKSTLQSYKIVVNIKKKQDKNNLLAGGLKYTPENFANFCSEVGQLLCRSLAITHEKFYKSTSG